MKIEINGLDSLMKVLGAEADLNLSRIIRKHGGRLHEEMQRKAIFKGHYEGKRFVKPTGATKRSIRLTFRDGGLTSAVGPRTEYSPYLEFGTRYMAAQPFVGPALDAVKDGFLNDLVKFQDRG